MSAYTHTQQIHCSNMNIKFWHFKVTV